MEMVAISVMMVMVAMVRRQDITSMMVNKYDIWWDGKKVIMIKMTMSRMAIVVRKYV